MDVILPLYENNYDVIRVSQDDIVIKDEDSQLWMRLKIKFYNKKCLINHPFEDFLLVMVDKNSNNVWAVPRSYIKNQTYLVIGTKISKFDKYKTTVNNLINNTSWYIKETKLFPYEQAISKAEVNVEHPVKIEYTYEHISTLVESKGCKIISKKDYYTNTKGKITIMYQCTHEEVTTYNNFMRKTYNLCKDCINQQLSEQGYDEINNAPSSSVRESNFIKMLCEKLNQCKVFKTHECCLADIAVKPKDKADDLWLPIQVKTTGAKGKYFLFNIKNAYPDMLVLCAAPSENKYWLFNGNNILGKERITIGRGLSKNDENEVKFDELENILCNCYLHSTYFDSPLKLACLEDLNIPINDNSKKEHVHRLKRENVIKNIFIITYPQIDNSKVDCYINGLKIQDKAAYKQERCIGTYRVNLSNNCYAIGDIDLYWIYITEESLCSKFFVLPESVLIDNDFFKDGILKSYISFTFDVNHKFHKYMFDYQDLDIARLKGIILGVQRVIPMT